MTPTHLIKVLKQGNSYTITPPDGEPYNVLEPPNKYMLAAARVIEGMIIELDKQVKINLQLQKYVNKYFQTKEQDECHTENV